MYIDSHCHLNFPELREDIDSIDAAMQQAHVRAALLVCTTMEEFPDVYALSQRRPYFWASVGVHPDSEGVHEPDVDELLAAAAQPGVIAIGETGLDYYRLNGRSVADMEWQRARFRTHIQAAQRCRKPLIIHTRSAADDTLAILREQGETGGAQAAGGVFHCFTESLDVARAALDLGFYISLSGIVTFRNAQALREVAAFVPTDRLLIETDSPYLAPVPYRGKTNTPAYVPHVAEAIAHVRQCSAEDIGLRTSHNFCQLFQVSLPHENAIHHA